MLGEMLGGPAVAIRGHRSRTSTHKGTRRAIEGDIARHRGTSHLRRLFGSLGWRERIVQRHPSLLLGGRQLIEVELRDAREYLFEDRDCRGREVIERRKRLELLQQLPEDGIGRAHRRC